jgi:hypothetical protein
MLQVHLRKTQEKLLELFNTSHAHTQIIIKNKVRIFMV